MPGSNTFKPPASWVHVPKANYPYLEIGWGEYWVQTMGIHIECQGDCDEQMQARYKEDERVFDCIEFASTHVPMRPVPVLAFAGTGPEIEQILVGACQVCGTVFWTEYAPPSEEERLRRAAEYEARETTRQQQITRETQFKQARAVCAERGHLVAAVAPRRREGRRKQRERTARCGRCGDIVPVE